MTPETPATPVPPPSPWKTWGIRFLKAGITFLALYLTWRLLANIQWADLRGRLAAAALPPLIAGTVLLVVRFIIWDGRFRIACKLAAGRSSGPVFGFFVFMASAALNLITPSARLIGGLVRARYFARAVNRPFGFLYGVVLYDQVAHQVMMTLCTWITVIVASFALGRPGLGWGALGTLLALAGALAVWVRRQKRHEDHPLVRFLARGAEKAEGKMQRFYAHGHEAVGVFARLLTEARLHGFAALLGASFFLANAAAQWLIFFALGERVNPFIVIAAVALGNAAGAMSGTPGGLGTTEAAMVASFEAMGVDPVEAAAGTLLFRGIHYVIVLVLGLPAIAFFELRLGGGLRPAKQSAD